ncbi:MAG: hypothetical protein VKN33_05565 [Candidatus Sericytochromatia bacterium]|nr:hypothetical protein [Candidatus Sericytochromatia bacterium]
MSFLRAVWHPILLPLTMALVTACQSSSPGVALVTQKNEAAAVPARQVAMTVFGLSDIAEGQSRIISMDAASLISAGGMNLISAGGMNLISAGGMNFTTSAKNSGAFRLQAEGIDSNYLPVSRAVITVRYLDLEGELVAPVFVRSDDDGKVTFQVKASTVPLEATAMYMYKGKTYRITAPIPEAEKVTSVIDPIYHVVCSRIRSIIAETKGRSPAFDPMELKAVWNAVNESEVTLTSDMLETSKSLDDLKRFYESLLPQIKDEAKKKIITDYMQKIKTFK